MEGLSVVASQSGCGERFRPNLPVNGYGANRQVFVGCEGERLSDTGEPASIRAIGSARIAGLRRPLLRSDADTMAHALPRFSAPAPPWGCPWSAATVRCACRRSEQPSLSLLRPHPRAARKYAHRHAAGAAAAAHSGEGEVVRAPGPVHALPRRPPVRARRSSPHAAFSAGRCRSTAARKSNASFGNRSRTPSSAERVVSRGLLPEADVPHHRRRPVQRPRPNA